MNASKDKNFLNKNSNEKNALKEIKEALPNHLRDIFVKIPSSQIENIEEIRLRMNRPFIINIGSKDYFINSKGEIVSDMFQSYIITKEDIEKAYQIITDYSIYALEEEIRNGFVTLKGGHRVGICGRTVLKGDEIKTIKDISGLNIRVSRQKIGISDQVIHYLIGADKEFYNTLIVSPPQCGKTTLLRDIIRNLSNGMHILNFPGFRVGVVDERSEICSMYQGIPQNDIGIRTDILDACPKAQGMMMLIRSMSPQIIATDEIGKREDVYAIEEAVNAGINIITTVHGRNLEEVAQRPNIRNLLFQGVFERVIILSNKPRVGTIREVINGKTKETISFYPMQNKR